MTSTRPGQPGASARLAVVPSVHGAAITGTVAEVAALVEHLRNTGADLTPVSANELRITFPAPAPAGLRAGWRTYSGRLARWAGARRVPLLATVLSLAAIGGLVWLIALAVAWLAAHLAVIAAVLIGLAALAIVTGSGACTTVIRITHHH